MGDAREEAQALAERVLFGDLQGADRSVAAQVLQLAARLHAGSSKTLDIAKRFRGQLLQVDPTASLTIVEALILDTEGEQDAALRLLRDVEEPDARGVFFALLAHHRGNAVALEWFESQVGRDAPDFFSGPGWSNLAVALAQTERWKGAHRYLTNATQHRDDYPDLFYLEGVVNTALMLRSDVRHLTLSTNLPPPYIIEGPETERYREHAVSCFTRAQEILQFISPGRASAAREWVLWLQLTHPAPQEKESATAEVLKELQSPTKGVPLVPLAQRFRIAFDMDRYWKHLDLRDRLGGLDDKELHARFILAELRLSPREFLAFLEQEEVRLSRLLTPEFLVSEKIRALLLDHKTAAARQLLEEHQSLFDKDEYERIILNLEAQEGRDPRVYLEKLYARTHALLDLQNLAKYLGSIKDWRALRPHQEELFQLERNVRHLLRLVWCMERDPEADVERRLKLLESNPDLVSRDLDLIASKARTFFHLGRLGEAKALSDKLLLERNSPPDLDFSIDLALQLGDWERFRGIIDREWLRREEHEPEVLIRLAVLASEADRTPSRAVELLKLAAQKGSDNPHILTTAIGLMYQLGREGPEITEWLSKALALSSEEGPVTRVELRKVIEEIIPKQQERTRKVEELWLKGEIPIHFASDHLNIPMSLFLLDLPRRNSQQQDGRRITIIPIASGARQPVLAQPGWRVGFDITSLMILYRLGILRDALTSFQQALIAPDTMLVLLNEKKKIRFQQPSLVKAAEEIRRLIDLGRLRVAEDLPKPQEELAEEVGHDLAQLLEAARREGGCVIRPRPIHKLRSFMNEEAQIGDFDDLILSAVRFEESLYERGYLDAETHKRASLYLRAQDQDSSKSAGVAVLEGPVYLDDLALAYLRQASLLPALEGTRLDLRIHPSVKEEQLALISSAYERGNLEENIEELRTILRDAMQAGQLGFLRRFRLTEQEEQIYQNAPTLSQLMRDVENCEAVSIDDRFLQRTGRMTDRSDRLIPVICALDVLHHLERQGVLSREQRHSKLHRLREMGFACIPVEPEELASYLPSRIRNDALVESVELRVIRTTLARIRSLDIIAPAEAFFLGQLQLSSIMVIRQIWSDEAISVEHAVQISAWIWQNVAPSPLDWLRVEPEESASLVGAFVYHLGLLLAPQVIKEERLESFTEWVQEDVLEPLLPANSGIVDELANYMARQIKSWSGDIEDDGQGTTRD